MALIDSVLDNICDMTALRKEFVDLTDMRVGTVREMQDLGLTRDEATAVKETLVAVWSAFKSFDSPDITKKALLELCDTTGIPVAAVKAAKA